MIFLVPDEVPMAEESGCKYTFCKLLQTCFPLKFLLFSRCVLRKLVNR